MKINSTKTVPKNVSPANILARNAVPKRFALNVWFEITDKQAPLADATMGTMRTQLMEISVNNAPPDVQNALTRTLAPNAP